MSRNTEFSLARKQWMLPLTGVRLKHSLALNSAFGLITAWKWLVSGCLHIVSFLEVFDVGRLRVLAVHDVHGVPDDSTLQDLRGDDHAWMIVQVDEAGSGKPTCLSE